MFFTSQPKHEDLVASPFRHHGSERLSFRSPARTVSTPDTEAKSATEPLKTEL